MSNKFAEYSNLNLSEINKESIYLFNLQGSLPKVRINNFLLTKPQRAELGLPTKEDEKLINSFIFYKTKWRNFFKST